MTNGPGLAEHFAEATKGSGHVAIEAVASGRCRISDCRVLAQRGARAASASDIAALSYFRFIPSSHAGRGVPCVVSRTGFGWRARLRTVLPGRARRRPVGCRHLPDECPPLRGGCSRALGWRQGSSSWTRLRGSRAHPYDLSFDRLVALGKVEFLRERSTRGGGFQPTPPAERLPRLETEGSRVGVEVTRSGEVVGTLTSPAVSPRFGPIALAILETPVSGDGELVESAVGDKTVAEPRSRHSRSTTQRRSDLAPECSELWYFECCDTSNRELQRWRRAP